MKAFAFSAVVFAVVAATVPGAYACGGSDSVAKPEHADLRNVDKTRAAEPDLAVLLGLLLGIILAEPVPAGEPCPGCTGAR